MSRPRKRPSQQRSREMVQWILEAAARVFDREGIGATTNRIAEEAGVSIGSLYQYFPDKHALMDELAMRHLDDAERALTAALAADANDLRSFVGNLVAVTAQLHEERGGMHRAMRDHALRSREVTMRFNRVIDRIVDSIEGELNQRGIGDAHGRARIIVAAVDGQVHRVLAGEPDGALREARIGLIVDQVMVLLREND